MSDKKRYYNNKGQVGVLVSNGHGAGWSSWNDEVDVFDYELIEVILTNQRAVEIEKLAKSKYPTAYLGGLDQLEVQFVDAGTKFHIHEYDGHETIETITDIGWLEA
jgi:hypothetical protein